MLSVGLVALLVLTREGLSTDGKVTLVVFSGAVAAWVFTKLDDTFVALAAALLLVLCGALRGDELFSALGGETIWLLFAAFVLAAGIGATGLPARVAVALVSRARGVRQLAHLVTLALVLTAFAVPATSGRAALALPVFLALAKGLADRPRVVRALALLFPTVILLSAVATLIGAGAHLITSHLLLTATGTGIGFGQWLPLEVPLAVVSSHVAAELVLWLFTRREDRVRPLWIDADALRRHTNAPTGRLSVAERRALAVLAPGAAAVLLGCVSGAFVCLLRSRRAREPHAGERECHVQRTVWLGLMGCLRAMAVTSRTGVVGPCSEPLALSWPRLAPGRRCQGWANAHRRSRRGALLMPAGRC